MIGPAADHDAEIRSGVVLGLLAYTLWGVFPVYFKWIEMVAPLEVMAHRILWAVPFGALIIFARRQWREVRGAFVDRSMLIWLTLSALSISVNWLIYIWAVQNARIFEASLGYYINPLMYVAVGVVVLGERLRRLQLIAVMLATIGVAYLTFSGGIFPWVALSLAALFTAYGVIRKQVAIGAMPGLFVETSLLFPFAFVFLGALMIGSTASFGSGDAGLTSLLMLGGPITVIPLLLFAIAAKRLSLTTIGFMQFIAPTLQFVTGLYYGEQLTTPHLVCFGLIWAAVVFFSYDAIIAGRKKPRQAKPAGA
ncbi:MAG: EamA family transporter RarD [Woeseiaceae bacterium]|nr:EamA family transporter RarD [Woeseiaceae bacterium]